MSSSAVSEESPLDRKAAAAADRESLAIIIVLVLFLVIVVSALAGPYSVRHYPLWWLGGYATGVVVTTLVFTVRDECSFRVFWKYFVPMTALWLVMFMLFLAWLLGGRGNDEEPESTPQTDEKEPESPAEEAHTETVRSGAEA